ncbi:alpha/beta hydrolase [Vibrio fluvialis]|uniref:alpha/beta hydrolase n=1 Tax=Vibrio sp. CJQ_6 TaxID=3367165 RepID=UPI001C9BC308|nr:alpha/beta hydrolase [Vibrio fluvialis]
MKRNKLIVSLLAGLILIGCVSQSDSTRPAEDTNVVAVDTAGPAGSGQASAASGGEVTQACGGVMCWLMELFGPADDRPNHVVMDVYYATDRQRVDNTENNTSFGTRRSKDITYGVAEVSIPKGHKIGEIERPAYWKLEFSEDPDDHLMLRKTEILNKSLYFNRLRSQFVDSENLLIFIHGYNVSFEDAALRTAQIAYDLSFKGAPVFYSWPSQAKEKSYMTDENNIRWSQGNIKNFITQVLEKTTSQNIYLIAHSMGTRALTQAYLDVMDDIPSAKSRIKEIILAAPDIDADLFKKDIAPKMVSKNSSVTLYVSSTDVALMMSKTIHGGYSRAGYSGGEPVIVEGIDTIDVTNVGVGFLNHSTFAEVRPVMMDIYSLIHHHKRAFERAGLEPVENSNGTYWQFKK